METSILALIRVKQRLLIKLLIVLIIFYFFIPFSLVYFPEWVLKETFVFGMPFLWLYTFMQLPMTWGLAWIYAHHAKKFEAQVAAIQDKGSQL